MKRLFQQLHARRKSVILERLQRLPFANHHALRVDLKLEGYKHYAFGAKSGPTYNFEALAHELGHAVQFGVEDFDIRCTSYGGFHLPVNEIEINGESYVNPETPQCTLREVEVFAIQYHLLTMAGYKVNFDRYVIDTVRICEFLPDWFLLGGPNGRKTEIPEHLEKFIDKWSPDQICIEMSKWLDKTAVRLSLAA